MLTFSGLGFDPMLSRDTNAAAAAGTIYSNTSMTFNRAQPIEPKLYRAQADEPRLTTKQTCPFGFSLINGVCMNDGCVTGKSQCIVSDPYGQTCSHDQFLAYQHTSGVPACGPDPAAVREADRAANAAKKAADAAAKAQADANTAAVTAQTEKGVVEAQRQQQYADQVAAQAAIAAQVAIDAWMAAHGNNNNGGTAPSPGMMVTPIVDPTAPTIQLPTLLDSLLSSRTLKWGLIGVAALGLAVLISRR